MRLWFSWVLEGCSEIKQRRGGKWRPVDGGVGGSGQGRVEKGPSSARAPPQPVSTTGFHLLCTPTLVTPNEKHMSAPHVPSDVATAPNSCHHQGKQWRAPDAEELLGWTQLLRAERPSVTTLWRDPGYARTPQGTAGGDTRHCKPKCFGTGGTTPGWCCKPPVPPGPPATRPHAVHGT